MAEHLGEAPMLVLSFSTERFGFKAFIAALSGVESNFASPRVLGVAQWAANVALSLILAALLLAWGRCHQRCYTWVAPELGLPQLQCSRASREIEVMPATQGRFSLLPHDSDGDASLQQPGSTSTRLKAIALAAFSYASLGIACFWAALGTGLALEVFRKEQAGGLPALAAFVTCLAVAGLALAAIARQEVHEADLRLGKVETWKMDPLSKAKGFQSWKAEALSTPVVITLQVVMERALFVWDMVSDVLVAMALLAHHPWWALITAAILSFPYLALSCLLGVGGGWELLAQLFPSTCAELTRSPCCWLVLPLSFEPGPPYFLLPRQNAFIDFTFVFQNIAWEPASTRLFHYWTLRQLLEVFLEANLQTALQGYIFFRQENFFNVFPALENTSVNPVLLAVSLASSARASVNGWTKLSSFARLQTHGSKWEFFQAMLVGGGGQGLVVASIGEHRWGLHVP
eukprot:s1298_g3.t1